MFKIVGNFQDEHSKRHIIQIQSETGNLQIITADFDEQSENWNNLSDKELIDKALEWQYRTFMQGKFMNEAVTIAETSAKEAKLLTEQIKESTELIQTLNEAKGQLEKKVQVLDETIIKSEEATARNNELIKTISLTINELVTTLMGGEDEADTETDTTV